ncbi:hypothetical protein L218DRAFT_977335 [Marasmius fiardii PR-910]|nr:hypothetical protein L218DRAFT_977335 [Marasmius fiardii PR-910]
MTLSCSIIFSILAVLAGVYHLYVSPILEALSIFRVHQPFNNFTSCSTIPELKACEKIVLHQSSGKLFLACSAPESRAHWAINHFDAKRRSAEDYVAIFDPTSNKVTRLTLEKFDSDRELSVHGMDVVPSSSNPEELFVYLVNHRPPLRGDPNKIGVDSVIEIFKTSLKSGKLIHLKTVEDPSIITPNDVSGDPDGKSFYFTNDHGQNNSIVLTDVIPCETPLDNLSIVTDGVVWGAGDALAFMRHLQDPSTKAPSVAWKFGINTGPNSFYGEKFKVERAFEDDGTLASCATTVVHDAERRLVFFHGVAAPWLTVCKV